jgi:hypothetical protein
MPPDAQTHTLPLVLMVVLVLIGVAALGLLYYRKRQLQGEVEGEFKGFREKAVALMDQLDALRQRHKTLPLTDPDFTAPMAGATLALYNAVESDLNVLWERWLKVMELWDRAQKLVRSGSGLAVRQAEEARKLLDQGNIDELLRQSASCKERLDRLNQGHEQARDVLGTGREELAVLRDSRDEGAGGRLPSERRHEAVARAEALLVQAEGMLAADPIGAEEVVARTRRSLASLAHHPAPEPEPIRPRRTRPAEYSPLNDLAAAAEGFRTAAARLRLTNLLGLFTRFWLFVWGFALLFGLLTPLLPLVIFGMGFVLVLAGFWAIWQTVTFWFWYGMWQMRR